MKINLSIIISLFLIFLLSFGCEKDNKSQELSIEANKPVQHRTATECDDLIKNGGFDDTFIPHGFSAFCGPNLPNWQGQTGSPDIVNNSWNWGKLFTPNQWWIDNNQSFPDAKAFCIASEPAVEVIEQSNLTIWPFLTYQLDFDVATTNWTEYNDLNGNLTVHTAIVDGTLPSFCSDEPVIPPVCGTNADCQNESISDGQIHPNYLHITQTFSNLPIGSSRLLIWATSDHPYHNIVKDHSYGVFFDNVELKCINENLIGINSVLVSGCTFDFSPDFSSPIIPSSILWDFGDGTTSDLLEPTHSYGSGGSYTVTLTIIDQNGCCATHEVEVICESCDHFICWSTDFGDDMQLLEDIVGLRINFANGTFAQYIWYTPPEDITGLHASILNNLRLTLSLLHGIPPENIQGDSPIHNCSKAGYTGPEGFFLTDIPISFYSFEFFGFNDNNNPQNVVLFRCQ